MPLIRINCPQNSFTAEQKAKLAPLLIAMPSCGRRLTLSPRLERRARFACLSTLCVFNEIATDNWSPGGNVDLHTKRPFWVVELFADAGFFNQKRRDDAQLAVGKAFVAVLGDDGSYLDWGGQHIAPAYLQGLYCLMMEIPEGSWGAFGRTLSTMEIAAIAGTDKNADRFIELKENTAKLKAARVS
jgi:phenylpyruvate tautomerase PptA (4-oxalocrotonate tautomerase family)